MNNSQAATAKSKTHPPIPPRQPDGTTLLPLARIKKIIKVDDEITQCSAPATFLISVATEMFIQHLAAAGHAQSRLDGAKTLRYKDLANAVARRDDLEFLCDIIPRTTRYRQVKEKKSGKTSAAMQNDDPNALEAAVALFRGAQQQPTSTPVTAVPTPRVEPAPVTMQQPAFQTLLLPNVAGPTLQTLPPPSATLPPIQSHTPTLPPPMQPSYPHTYATYSYPPHVPAHPHPYYQQPAPPIAIPEQQAHYEAYYAAQAQAAHAQQIQQYEAQQAQLAQMQGGQAHGVPMSSLLSGPGPQASPMGTTGPGPVGGDPAARVMETPVPGGEGGQAQAAVEHMEGVEGQTQTPVAE